jgi:nitrate/TMAO reductase-like tetraheme cytochrome c subunit
MTGADGKDNKSGILKKTWRTLRRPSTRYGAGTLVGAGLVVGLLLWVSFMEVVAYTNTVDFCTSCHVMEAFVVPDYTASPHYSNASGVRAICSDCHVPRAFLPKMWTKARATAVEIPGWLRGTIATQERFDARKAHLARRVLARMRASGSRECRGCHSWQAMSSEAQAPPAWREHDAGRASGETCVDCHQGVAHVLPSSMLEPADDAFDFNL